MSVTSVCRYFEVPWRLLCDTLCERLQLAGSIPKAEGASLLSHRQALGRDRPYGLGRRVEPFTARRLGLSRGVFMRS